jgi:hypothetical protein
VRHLAPRLLTWFCALLLLGATAQTARTDETERIAQAVALAEKLDTLRKAQERPALETELGKVAALHNALDDKPTRARLQVAVGDVLNDEALAATRLKAADVLGEMHDEKVWTQLKRAWPATDLEAALPIHLRVVAAAGKVAAPASVTPLLELARKAKDTNLVRAAMEALGGFGWAKNRVSILLDLGELIPLTDGASGGGARGAKVSADSAAAWRALKPTLLKALNDLTGRAEAVLESWTALLKQNKKNPEALFVRERGH